MRVLRGIDRFVYDFVIGDDWKIAAGVVGSLLVGALLLVAGFGVGVGGVFLHPLLHPL